MSTISSGVGGFQNPANISGQGTSGKPAPGASANATSGAQKSDPTDTNETKGAQDADTAALVQPDLTSDQARSLSADIGKQLSGQNLSIANRAPQALQAAFGG